MPRMICKNCSTEHNVTLTICPRCGCDRNAPLKGFAPSVVIEGPDAESGEHVLRVDDPSGVRSVARRSDEGRVSLQVTGAAGIGRPGEGRSAHTFKEFLLRGGFEADIRDGNDAEGVDRILDVDGSTFVLQFTIAVQAPDFWRQASVSSANTQVAQPDAASWLRQAILSKREAPKAHDLPTILVIDARHAAPVAHVDVVREYLSSHAEPVDEFGFSSVWLVGPTADHCCRIGKGRP